MKNNLLKYLTKAFLCLAMLGAVLMACNDDDESGAVVLNSFGPSPVLRGNEIRFIGENLDKVSSVIIPDAIEITDINVISSEEIRIVVPQEATVGYVILNYSGGVITTKTLLGFTEPYEITSIAPVGQPIRAGAEVTITGDYLNNIVNVVFAGDAAVDSADFVSQSRKEIKLTLPNAAVSGKLYVEDAAGNQLYSDQELTVLQPAVTALSATTIKPGQNLTITGTNFDLVTKIVFVGGTEVEAADFVSASATQIVVTTPANLQDGVVTLVAYSGTEITSASVTTVLPTNVQIAAETRFKTYLNVKITGADLDLVNAVTFTGADAITSFTYTSGIITVAIPAAATDGVVTLSTQSGKTVTTSAITLIKPVITLIDPLTVVGGNNITITGTDLDMVQTITFTGGLSVSVQPTTTSFTVTVPEAAQSGVVKLNTVNGTTVQSTDVLTVESPNVPVVTAITQQVKPGGLLTVEGSKLNLVESIVFQDGIKATNYVSRTTTKIEVYVPAAAKTGTVTVTLVTYGSEEVLSPTFSITGVDPILTTTVMVMDWEVHGGHNGSWDAAWGGNSEILTEDGNTFIRFTDSANGWLLNCNHQSSGALGPIISNIENYVLKFDIRVEAGVTGAENAELQFVFGNSWHTYGPNLLPSTTGGSWITVSVPVSALGLSETLNLSSGTNGLYGGVVPGGVSFDNLRFDLK
ncbi:MAG: glycan-binding surface protein [Mangrovibacterium sp.]